MPRRLLAVAVALAVVAATAASSAPPAGAEPEAVAYRPPADAVVARLFEPPAGRFAAGNRGVDYATAAGDPVWAAADGVVAFAGRVGGAPAVSVLHADGLRTTYSFLGVLSVRRGQRVVAGQALATAAGPFHFGVRAAGDVYLDPLALLSGRADGRVRLVPDRVRPEADERSILDRLLAGATRVFDGGVEWLTDVAGATKDAAAAGAALAGEWYADARRCTPRSVTPRRAPPGRVLVLVGGLGSNGRRPTIEEIDAPALGYAPARVHTFSYDGGTTGGPGGAYAPAATHAPAAGSAARLADLLADLRRRHPGARIDVVAHSQGGALAVAAAHQVAAAAPGGFDAHVVTLGSPLRGADLAEALAVGRDLLGPTAARVRAGHGVLTAPVVDDLRPGSDLVARVSGPLPAGVQLTSIAAAHDLVVPLARSHHPGADNRLVHVAGAVGDHGGLPASPEARREVALALAGQGETCTGVRAYAAALVGGLGLGLAERGAVAGLKATLPGPNPPRGRRPGRP